MVEPTKEQLQQIKDCELGLLKAFIAVCEKLSLQYYVAGGTLIGAVRHQGFIPWDDDIDVAMPRKDYEIFMKNGQELLPDHYFLQNHITDPEYPCNFAKIRDSRTTFIEYSIRHFSMNHGVYIDIFPLDFYPDQKGKQRLLDFKKSIFKYRFRKEMDVPEISKHHPLIEFGMNAVSAMTKLLYPKLRDAVIKREELFTSVKSGEMLAPHCGAWGKREIAPAEWYQEGTKLMFEGIEVFGPKEYDKLLRQVYGDYMQLPPKEKQVGHHYAQCIDLDKPYTAYTNK